MGRYYLCENKKAHAISDMAENANCIKVCVYLGCEQCTTKALLYGLRGVLFSSSLPWSTCKVGSKNAGTLCGRSYLLYLEQKYSDIYIQAFGKNVFTINRDFKEISSQWFWHHQEQKPNFATTGL